MLGIQLYILDCGALYKFLESYIYYDVGPGFPVF